MTDTIEEPRDAAYDAAVKIREYSERYPVELVVHHSRLCLRATNEGGCNDVIIDLLDICDALPALLTADPALLKEG